MEEEVALCHQREAKQDIFEAISKGKVIDVIENDESKRGVATSRNQVDHAKPPESSEKVSR